MDVTATSTPLMSPGEWSILWVLVGLPFTVFAAMILIGRRSNPELNKGEMRRALAGFVIVLFGLLVATSFFPEGPDVPKEIQGIFAGAVATIIGFYFGSRASEPRPPDKKTSGGEVEPDGPGGKNGRGDRSPEKEREE